MAAGITTNFEEKLPEDRTRKRVRALELLTKSNFKRAFEIAFSQQFQRANPLAGSIFGELFFEISRNSCGHAISGQTLVSSQRCMDGV
ncbi:hypothetical protein [Rubripirellula tenax]|uniref:hypothetical protein n=1 Tax=Rubripirellula tenax TaxID=2528015 RepID=UPI0011B56A3F|nr:hypothetical protein [Rubripirellula tenax]